MHNSILILDFGSQVTQLIARRVRDEEILAEIFPYDINPDTFKEIISKGNYKGIILSGGPNSVTNGDTPRAPDLVFTLGIPVLGICYGMQTMAQQLGGDVKTAEVLGKSREFGYAEVRARGHTKLLDGINDFVTAEGYGFLKVWMSHGDSVNVMPPGFKLMASTESCPIAGMADESRNFYALQFHPEVTHTLQGIPILRRFVKDICGCIPDWKMGSYVDEAILKIQSQVGEDEVI